MPTTFSFSALDPSQFPNWTFENIELEFDTLSGALWMYYKREAPPYYSLQTLNDIASLRESMWALMRAGEAKDFPLRYLVMASRKPGVFNLGGDLAMFAQSIRDKKQDTLRMYAHACVDLVYGLATGFGLPLLTVAVVAGKALGGGFECALAQDFLIAEETAKMGVPEVAFNTFPGMGAITLLSRRLGTAQAEDMISSGTTYTSRRMFDMGVVDLLAPEGRSQETAQEWLREGGSKRFDRRLQIAQTRRRIFPVSREELIKITDLWVSCSLDVTAQDIRHMERLAAAQKRILAE